MMMMRHIWRHVNDGVCSWAFWVFHPHTLFSNDGGLGRPKIRNDGLDWFEPTHPFHHHPPSPIIPLSFVFSSSLSPSLSHF